MKALLDAARPSLCLSLIEKTSLMRGTVFEGSGVVGFRFSTETPKSCGWNDENDDSKAVVAILIIISMAIVVKQIKAAK